MSRYLGDVSAYAYAVSKGYTGTEEEFAELMASYASVAEDAGASARAAASSAADASASKTAAGQSEANAAQSESAAATSEGQARTAASNAGQSETNAGNSASAAAGSASQAALSATQAANSAQSANLSATDANTAKSGAEEAQTKAETAQTKAETAQGKAEEAQSEAEQAAQGISESLEQIATNTADIVDVKTDLTKFTGNSVITFTNGGYIAINGSTGATASLTPIPSASWQYAIIPCSVGDAYTLNVTGTTGERAYAFLDSSYTILSTRATTAVTLTNEVVIAPDDAAYLVINNNDFTATSYIGMYLVDSISRRIAQHKYDNSDNDARWELFDYKGVEKRTVSNWAVNYDYVAGNLKSFYGKMTNTSTMDLRFFRPSGSEIACEGIAAFKLTCYIPDVSLYTGLTLEVLGTSFSRGFTISSAQSGWNELVVYTTDGSTTTWDNFRQVRIFSTGQSGREIYIAKIEYLRPNKGYILFVEDGGYASFLTDGYPDLKNLNAPCTWALDPALLGTGSRITQENVDSLAEDGASEFSWHGWESTPTANMSVAELQDETAKCLHYLRKNGLLPQHFWKAAFTQNQAVNGMALKEFAEALATSTSNSSPTLFPFPNRYNVPRVALHSLSETGIAGMFDKIKKTHCVYVLYTHGIGTGQYETTSENWAYFINALQAAMNEGYVEATTYNRLCLKESL